MKTDKFHAKSQGWSVVVLYEDTPSREDAVRFCDRLVERFWQSREFDIHWASFSTLKEEADNSSNKIAHADVLIFAASAEGAMPEETVAWIEESLAGKGDREGALVGLLHDTRGTHSELADSQKHSYLRCLAHRLSMDYLTEIPQHLSRLMPDSLESYCARADRVTNVLDEILHQNVTRPGLRN
jgi:hypothetical protein